MISGERNWLMMVWFWSIMACLISEALMRMRFSGWMICLSGKRSVTCGLSDMIWVNAGSLSAICWSRCASSGKSGSW